MSSASRGAHGCSTQPPAEDGCRGLTCGSEREASVNTEPHGGHAGWAGDLRSIGDGPSGVFRECEFPAGAQASEILMALSRNISPKVHKLPLVWNIHER